MNVDKPEGDFLRRWSRLKTQARRDEQQPVVAPEPAAPRSEPAGPATPPAQRADGKEAVPALPPVESLGIESDYRPFLHPKIEEGVRRAALKKLFSDPHFNVMDGLDVYIDDYTKSDPLPAGMLDQLEHAKKILAWSAEDAEARAKAQTGGDAVEAEGGEAAAALPEAAQPESAADGPEAPASATSSDAALVRRPE